MQNIPFNTGVIRPVEVYKEAWNIIKSDYWMVFAVDIVGFIVAGAVPLVLVGPMMCGIYMVLLGKMKGQPVDFQKLFKGFDFFLPSLLLTVIIMLPFILLLIIFYIPIIAMTFLGGRMSESEFIAFIVALVVVELIVGLIMVCMHSLLLFAYPLMADKKLPATECIKLSVRACWSNIGGVVGMMGVGFLVCIIGYLMLCIGIYLVMPLIMMATAVAYRKVFPANGSDGNFVPPALFGER